MPSTPTPRLSDAERQHILGGGTAAKTNFHLRESIDLAKDNDDLIHRIRGLITKTEKSIKDADQGSDQTLSIKLMLETMDHIVHYIEEFKESKIEDLKALAHLYLKHNEVIDGKFTVRGSAEFNKLLENLEKESHRRINQSKKAKTASVASTTPKKAQAGTQPTAGTDGPPVYQANLIKKRPTPQAKSMPTLQDPQNILGQATNHFATPTRISGTKATLNRAQTLDNTSSSGAGPINPSNVAHIKRVNTSDIPKPDAGLPPSASNSTLEKQRAELIKSGASKKPYKTLELQNHRLTAEPVLAVATLIPGNSLKRVATKDLPGLPKESNSASGRTKPLNFSAGMADYNKIIETIESVFKQEQQDNPYPSNTRFMVHGDFRSNLKSKHNEERSVIEVHYATQGDKPSLTLPNKMNTRTLTVTIQHKTNEHSINVHASDNEFCILAKSKCLGALAKSMKQPVMTIDGPNLEAAARLLAQCYANTPEITIELSEKLLPHQEKVLEMAKSKFKLSAEFEFQAKGPRLQS